MKCLEPDHIFFYFVINFLAGVNDYFAELWAQYRCVLRCVPQECGPLDSEAMVMGVLDQSFDVLVLRYRVQKRIYCKVGLHFIEMSKKAVVKLTELPQNQQFAPSPAVLFPPL